MGYDESIVFGVSDGKQGWLPRVILGGATASDLPIPAPSLTRNSLALGTDKEDKEFHLREEDRGLEDDPEGSLLQTSQSHTLQNFSATAGLLEDWYAASDDEIAVAARGGGDRVRKAGAGKRNRPWKSKRVRDAKRAEKQKEACLALENMRKSTKEIKEQLKGGARITTFIEADEEIYEEEEDRGGVQYCFGEEIKFGTEKVPTAIPEVVVIAEATPVDEGLEKGKGTGRGKKKGGTGGKKAGTSFLEQLQRRENQKATSRQQVQQQQQQQHQNQNNRDRQHQQNTRDSRSSTQSPREKVSSRAETPEPERKHPRMVRLRDLKDNDF